MRDRHSYRAGCDGKPAVFSRGKTLREYDVCAEQLPGSENVEQVCWIAEVCQLLHNGWPDEEHGSTAHEIGDVAGHKLEGADRGRYRIGIRFRFSYGCCCRFRWAWNPARHLASILLVLRTEACAQRGLLVEHHKHVHSH